MQMLSKPPATIDRTFRNIAACIIESLLSGQISINTLITEWPRESRDPAFREIKSYLEEAFALPEQGTDIVSKRDQFMKQTPAVLDQGRKGLLVRAAEFLRTDLEYSWPVAPYDKAFNALGCVTMLAFVAIFPCVFVARLRPIVGAYAIVLFAACLLSWCAVSKFSRIKRDQSWVAFGDKRFFPFESEITMQEARRCAGNSSSPKGVE